MHVRSLCAAYLPWFPHAQHGDQALSQHLLHFARNGIVVILRKERSVFICYDENVPRRCVKYNIPLRCVTVDTIKCNVIQHNAVCSDTLLQYNTIQCNTSQYMMMQHCIMLRSRLEWSVTPSLIGCCPTYFTSSFLFDCFLFTNYATWHRDVCTFHFPTEQIPFELPQYSDPANDDVPISCDDTPIVLTWNRVLRSECPHSTYLAPTSFNMHVDTAPV